MSSRVTGGMLIKNMLVDLQSNLSKMQELQHQLSTGRSQNKPSDNPVGVVRETSLTTSLYENEQFQSNLNDGVTWLDFTDSSLDQIQSVTQRIRELAVYAGDAALSSTDMGALADEVSRLRDELRQVCNSTVEGRYLFSGYDTSTKPFEMDANENINYKGDLGSISFEMEIGETAQVNLTGRDVMPENEERYSLRSYDFQQSWRWEGRNEILYFQVGDRFAKVKIPEKWTDRDGDNQGEPSDNNAYRDVSELDGYSLSEIANIINTELGQGDVGKLVEVQVITDSVTTLQHLEFRSRTDEPLQIVGYLDPEGVNGAAYSDTSDANEADADINGSVEAAYTIKTDLNHMDLARALGVGTAAVTMPVTSGALFGFDNASPLHMRLTAGDNNGAVYMNANASLKEIAASIKASCGSWLNVAYEEDTGDPAAMFSTQGMASGAEQPQGRLVLFTKDGTPLSVMDMEDSPLKWAEKLGFNSVLETDWLSGWVSGSEARPTSVCVLPEILNVKLGSDTYRVKIRDGTALSALSETIVSQIGSDLIGAEIQTSAGLTAQRLVLWSKMGDSLSLWDGDYTDPSYVNYAGDIARSMKINPGANTLTALTDAALGVSGTFRIEAGGRYIDINVQNTETLSDIASSIRSSSKEWLDVSYWDETISVAGSDAGFSIRSRDNSPIVVKDLYNSAAAGAGVADVIFGGMAAARGPVMTSNTAVAYAATAIASSYENDMLRIEIGGAWTAYTAYTALSLTSPGGVTFVDISGLNIDQIADRINARLQGFGAKVELQQPVPPDGNRRLAVYSPNGLRVDVEYVEPPIAGTLGSDAFSAAGVSTGTWIGGRGAVAQLQFPDVPIAGGNTVIDIPAEGMNLTGLRDYINSNKSILESVRIAAGATVNASVKATLVDAGANQRIAFEVTEDNVTATYTSTDAVPIFSVNDRDSQGTAANIFGLDGMQVQGQVVPKSSLGEKKSVDFFTVLKDLDSAMRQEDRDGISKKLLQEIDDFMDNLLQKRAKVGARTQRFEMTASRLTRDNVTGQDLLSKVADTDMASVIMMLKMKESVYRSSLAVGARVIQPSLLDFLN